MNIDQTRTNPTVDYGVLVSLEEMSAPNSEYGEIVRVGSWLPLSNVTEYGSPVRLRLRWRYE